MEDIVIDVSKSTWEELIKAKQVLQRAIEQRQDVEKKTVIRQIRELAKTYHLSIQDILSETEKTERKQVKPKYQHLLQYVTTF